MTVQITDPKLLEQLLAGGESIEFTGPNGRKIGTFTAARSGMLPAGVKSPFAPEEMEKRSQDDSVGRPLADILRDLQERYPA